MQKKQETPSVSNIQNKEQTVKPYKYMDFMSKFSFQYWKEKFNKSVNIRKAFLVVMKLRNNKYDMFTIYTSEQSFTYMSGSYTIDADQTEIDVHTNLPILFYHQDSTLPFKLSFNIDTLRKTLELQDREVVKALNPSSLKAFINSQVIEKVLKGQELTDELRFLKMLILINTVVVIGSALVLAKSIGWF